MYLNNITPSYYSNFERKEFVSGSSFIQRFALSIFAATVTAVAAVLLSQRFKKLECAPFHADPTTGSVSYESNLKPSDLKKNPKGFEAVNEIFKRREDSNDRINEMRENISSTLERGGPKAGEKVGLESGEKLRDFLRDLYLEAEEVVEKHTGQKKPTEYTPVVFGSTARDDGGAYPDLDFALLIDKKTPETIAYFEKLNQHVADRIHLLGESNAGDHYGIHACYGGATPFFRSFGWRYQNIHRMEELESSLVRLKKQKVQLQKKIDRTPHSVERGVLIQEAKKLKLKVKQVQKDIRDDIALNADLYRTYAGGKAVRARGTMTLIDTPESMAKWADPRSDKKAKQLANSFQDKHEIPSVQLEWQMSNVGLYTDITPVDRDSAKLTLVDRFFTERQRILNEKPLENNGFTRAEKVLSNIIQDNVGGYYKTLPKEGPLDIKRGLWRFPQLMISHLSQVNGVDEMNSFKRIDRLQKEGILSPKYAKEFKEVYDFLVALRAKSQMHYRSEQHKVYASPSAKNQLLTKGSSSIDERLKQSDKDLDLHHRKHEKVTKKYKGQEESPEAASAFVQLRRERKVLYKEREELLHEQLLENGLVLTLKERRMIEERVIPFLENLESNALRYLKNGMKGRFG